MGQILSKGEWEGVIFLTNQCNLRCSHCLVTRSAPQELPLEALERVIEFEPKKVNLLGGEPLLYPRLADAIRLFADRGIPVTLSTNGLLITERRILKLGLDKLRAVLVSVEGFRKSTDGIRGKGVFSKALRAARLTHMYGIDTYLRSSYWRDNLEEIPELIKLAREKGFGLVLFPRLDQPPLSIPQQTWLFKLVSEYERAWVDIPSFWIYTRANLQSTCPAGLKRVGIHPDGSITPCQWNSSHLLGWVWSDWDLIQSNAEVFRKSLRPASTCHPCESVHQCNGCCPEAQTKLSCPLGEEVRDLPPKAMVYFRPPKKPIKLAGLRKKILRGIVTC